MGPTVGDFLECSNLKNTRRKNLTFLAPETRFSLVKAMILRVFEGRIFKKGYVEEP